MAARVGRTGHMPRFAGVRVSAPDHVAAWGIVQQVAGGEYAYPGLTPRRGDRVIDIGANVGIYSLWAERRGATVIAAYEPGPDAFAALASNVADRRVAPIHAAVVGKSQTGSVDLFVHGERSTRNTVVGREIGSGAPLEQRVTVPAVPIHEVLAEPCDLLKIDCEGAEFDIMASASTCSLRRIERIILEFHRTVGDPQSLIARLTAAGFAARILAGEDPEQPFGVIGAQRRG
jgi:FkbM family methyltransferase